MSHHCVSVCSALTWPGLTCAHREAGLLDPSSGERNLPGECLCVVASSDELCGTRGCLLRPLVGEDAAPSFSLSLLVCVGLGLCSPRE